MVNEYIGNSEKISETVELLIDTLRKQAEIQNIFSSARLRTLTERKNIDEDIWPYDSDIEDMQKSAEAVLRITEVMEKLERQL